MMKLSKQMRKSMDDADAGLPISWPIDHWANEVAKLEEENEALREALGNILAGSYNAEYVRIVAEQAIRQANQNA